MKNWYSKLLAEINQEGRTVFRLLSVVLSVTLISLPIYTFVAIQTGHWQMYAIQAGLVIFFLINVVAAHQARHNRAELAANLLIAGGLFIIPYVVAFMAGLGMVMSLTLFFAMMAIVGLTLTGRAAVRAIILSILFSSATIVLDLFAPWERLTIPLIQSSGSITSAVALIIVAFLALRQFPSFSMRIKTVIALVIAALISITAVSFASNRILVSQINKQVGTNLSEMAQSVAYQIASTMDQYRGTLEALAINDRLQEMVETANRNEAPGETTWKQIDEQWKAASYSDSIIQQVVNNELAVELREYRSRLPEMVEIFVTDQFGQVLAATDRTSDFYQADEEWWQRAWADGKGKPFISQPGFDDSSGVYAINMAIPIMTNDGTAVIGVLRTTLEIQQFKLMLTAGQLGETGRADLIFSDYQYISDDIASGFGSYNSEVLNNLLAIQNGGYGQFDYEGHPSLVSISSVRSPEAISRSGIDQLNWKVVVHQQLEEAQLPVTVSTRVIVLVANILLIFIGLLAYYFGSLFTKPLEELAATAILITKGDLNVQAPELSKDETGMLARTFNAMTAQLRDLIGTLEQRVADRTKALATSGEISRRLSTITEQKRLVQEVVEQLQSAFNYYHVHIYLMDESSEFLNMAGGTGEAGRLLLERGHRIPHGRGLVGRAADTRQPIIAPDTRQDPNWLPNPLLPETRSEIAVPITTGDEVLGVLDVQNNTSESLTQQDAELIQSIASQFAIALQNIRQYENTQKMASDLKVVANVGIATSNITEIKRLLQEVVDLSKESFRLYHAHIYLLSEDGYNLQLAAGAGEVGRKMLEQGHHIPLNSEQSIVARAARTHRGVVVNNVNADIHFLPNPLLPGTRSEMAVPMVVGGQLIGVLDVQSETLDRFSDVDVSIETTLASQVGIAVQNARSFTQTQRQAEQESKLNLISQRIQRATSIDAALQIAVRELGHALGMKSTLVALEPPALRGDGSETRNQ